MASLFKTMLRCAAMFFAIGAGLSMALIFLIVFFNAFIRYIFGDSLEWGGQIPIFLGIYGVMFGMALAYLQDRHVRLGVIIDFLPTKVRDVLFGIVDICMVVIGGLLCWSGYLFMSSRGSMRISGMSGAARSLRETTGIDALGVLGTMAPYQFALVLGGAMLAVAAALKFCERLTTFRASSQ